MMFVENEFEKLVVALAQTHDVSASQMFGKKCIKINKKAGIALFKDCIVFKLPKKVHADAISLEGSCLWDPSGKGRAMKEWVQLPLAHKSKFKEFAQASANYVG